MTKIQREYQVESAILSCEARIDNGADKTEAFNWLREELQQVDNGIEVYDEN